MFIGGFGFISGGGGGGGTVDVVDVVQLRAAAAPAPLADGTATFTPTPATAIRGNFVTVYVNGGGYLENAVQFEFDTDGTNITEIRLLNGLLFNTGEFWTFTGLRV